MKSEKVGVLIIVVIPGGVFLVFDAAASDIFYNPVPNFIALT